MNLALFDLDHTLIPLDSDYEWGQFMVRVGAVDPVEFGKRNAEFYRQYQVGELNPVEYLEFLFGTLSRFPRTQLDAWHNEFMDEIICPALRPSARNLLQKHRDAGDLICIVTATNRFVTAPIATAFGVEHLIAAEPELKENGDLTGNTIGTPPYGPGKIVNTKSWLADMDKTLESFERSYFYSDSQNDIPLLSLVTHPVATNPNEKLTAHAKTHGWPILNLFDD
ncbi:MAG: family hydrolase [Paucimonas sp.]|nr:family hydrolase [Paucimonas sp.]